MPDDVIFNLEGDSSSAVSALNNIQQAADNAKQAIDNIATAMKDFDDAMSNLSSIAANFQVIGDAATAANTLIDSLANAASGAASSLAPLGSGLSDVSTALDLVSSTGVDAAAALDGIQTSADATVTGVDALGTSSLDASGYVDKMAAAASGAVTGLNDVGTQGTAAALALIDASNAATEAAVNILELDKQSANLASSMEILSLYADDGSVALGSLSSTSTDVNTAMADLLLALKDVTTSMQQIASTADAAAAGLANVGSSAKTAAAGVAESKGEMEEANTAGENNGMMLMTLVPLLLQAGGGFAKMGMDAQTAVAHITGLAAPSLAGAGAQKELNGVLTQVEGSAEKYGVSMSQAADGLYYVLSAGFSTNDALTVLNNSMEASAATGTQMNDVSNALTSVLHAYGLGADHAGTVTNQMVEAVVQGKQNFSEFASTIGRTAAAGAAAGISFDQVAAAEATLTQINPSVQRDTQQLAHLFEALTGKTDHFKTVAASLHKKFDENAFASKNLIDKLKYLANIAGGDTGAAFQKLMGDQVSASVAFDLLNGKATRYTDTLKNIDKSQGALDLAFQQSEQTIGAAWAHVTSVISVLAYKLVVIASPVVTKMMHSIADAIQHIASNSQILLPILIAVSVAFGVLLIGAIGTLLGTIQAFLVPTGAIALVLGALTAAVVYLAPKFLEWYHSAQPLSAEMRILVDVLRSVAGAIGGAFMDLFKAMAPLMQAIGEIIKTVVLPALANFAIGLGSTLASMGQKFVDFLRAAAPVIQKFGTYVQVHIVPALQVLEPKINAVARRFGELFPYILAAGGALMGFAPAIFKLIGGFGGIGKALSSIWPFFQLLARGVLGLGPAIRGIIPLFNTLKGVLGGAFTTALGVAKDLIVKLALSWQLAGNPLNFFSIILRAAAQSLMGFIADLAVAIGPVVAIASVIAILVGAMVVFFTTTSQGKAMLGVLWGAIQNLWSVLVAALQPAILSVQQAIARLQPVWGQLVEAFKMALPAIQVIGGIIGGILVAALGIVIGIIAGVITALGQFIAGVITAASGIIQALAGVVQFVMGFLALIVAAFHGNGDEAQRAWDMMGKGLKNIWDGLWTAIKGVFQATVGALLGFFKGFGTSVIGFFTNLYKVIVGNSIWPDMWKGILNVAINFGFMVISNIVAFFVKIVAQFLTSGMKIVTQAIHTWLQVWGAINNALKMIITIITSSWNLILAIVQLAVVRIWGIVLVTWAQIRAAIQVAQSAISALLRGDWNGFLSLITQAAKMIWMACMRFFTAIMMTIGQAMDVVWLIIRTTWNAIYNIVTNIATTLWLAIEKMWILIVKWFSDGADAVISTVRKWVDDVKKFFDGLVKQGQKWGKDFMDAFAKAITDGIGAVTGAAQKVADALKSILGHSTPSEGPMAGDDQWMVHFMQNMQQGIEKNRNLVKQAAMGVASDIAVTVPTTANIAASVSTPTDQGSSEHIEVLKQILATLQSQGKGGAIGSQIGYNIPSTQLGSVNQQFNNTNNFSINDVANMYSQINQLAGLSNEYASRGAITGVGF